MKEIILGQNRPDVPGISEKTRASLTVLRMYTLYAGDCRLRILYTAPGGITRPDRNGPVLPGPYAPMYPIAAFDDEYGGSDAESLKLENRGLEFEVQAGDHILMDGVEWEIRDYRRMSYPELVPASILVGQKQYTESEDWEHTIENSVVKLSLLNTTE